jgi:hypothetical protein
MGEDRHARDDAGVDAAISEDDRSVHQHDTARLHVIARRRRVIVGVGVGEAWRIFGAVIICFAIILLLNTKSVVRIADEQPDGWTRPVLLASAHGLDAVASTLRLDRMNAWIDGALNRQDDAPTFTAIAVNPPMMTATPATVAAPAGGAATVAQQPAGVPATPPPGIPAPSAPALRTVTTANPLRVYVAGDSFATWMGYDFADYAKRDDLIASLLDFKISSGLARPDYFDWPARLTQAMAGNPPPEAVVWFSGANDYVDMRTDSASLTRDTPEWLAEYRKRAGEVMDIVGRSGGQMYWVGQPIMRDKARAKAAADINTIVQAEAESRPWVHYLDIWAMFTDANGGYVTFLPDSSGELVRVRQDEGIHLTRVATTWVSDRVYAAIRHDFSFPVAGSR